MALMTTTGFGQDIVNPVVRALWNHALEEQSSELYYMDMGLSDLEPDVPNGQLNSVTGPGRGALTVEGEVFFSNTKYREYPAAINLRKYTSELSWTDEDLHWLEKANSSSKQVIDFTNMPSQAVQALQQNINEDACKVYYLGFGTTFLNCGNSEALYGSHTIRATGASQKNTFPTASGNLPLASTSLTQAITIMNRFKSQNNIQELKVRNLRLIVTVELEPTALQIKWSDYGPLTNNLGLQTAGETVLSKQGINLEVVVARDIPTTQGSSTYSTYWFLVEMNRAKTRAFMCWAWKPRLNEHPDYRKGTWFSDASTLFGPAVQGWQHTFASKGDSSAS